MKKRKSSDSWSDFDVLRREGSTKDGSSWCLLIANGRKQTRASQCLPIIMYANVEICEFLQCGSWENIWSMVFPSALLCSMYDLGVKGSPERLESGCQLFPAIRHSQNIPTRTLDQRARFQRRPRFERTPSYRANIFFDLKLYHQQKRKRSCLNPLYIHIRSNRRDI